MKTRLIAIACLAIVLFATGSASATEPAGSSNDYLALGDSVVFGYIDQAGYEYFYPENFVGYADWTSLTLSLNPVNAGCPVRRRAVFFRTLPPTTDAAPIAGPFTST